MVAGEGLRPLVARSVFRSSWAARRLPATSDQTSYQSVWRRIGGSAGSW